MPAESNSERKTAQPEVQDETLVEHALQKAFFAEQAESFDQAPLGGRANRNHFAKVRRIAKWVGDQQNARVLEVGAGTGIHADWLLQQCRYRYVGVDISRQMLAVARRKLGNEVQLLQSAGESLPFRDASFDAVFCSATLHHVADRGRAIREMARVVKPNSRVIISEPNKWNPLNIWARLTIPVERGVGDMTVANFRKWFRDAGLLIDHFEFFNFTPPKPICLSGPFRQIDRLAARIPIIRRIASMILFVGRRAGQTTTLE